MCVVCMLHLMPMSTRNKSSSNYIHFHIHPLHNSIAVSQLDATTLQASVKSCPHTLFCLPENTHWIKRVHTQGTVFKIN